MLERFFEKVIFQSRWLMAPFYLGLIVALALLLIKFATELWHSIFIVFDVKGTEIILVVLDLIDMSLAGNLLLMVIFAGYENFVSKIDTGDDHRPAWMGQVDFGGLKIKLVGSIVAISAIHLLRSFMNMQSMAKDEIFWQLAIHMGFVVSGVLMALMDRLSAGAHKAPQ
ncbi:MAG: TIGR00645 family protein [Dongiaceae bacterium]